MRPDSQKLFIIKGSYIVIYITLKISKALFKFNAKFHFDFDIVFLSNKTSLEKVVCMLQKLICYPIFCLNDI